MYFIAASLSCAAYLCNDYFFQYPYLNLPFFIARRYLVRQKGTFSSFIIRLAIVATALSVAVMLLALAFIAGFRDAIRGKLFTFWGNVHIAQSSPDPSAELNSPDSIPLDTLLLYQVRNTPHVLSVMPYILRPAIVRARGTIDGLQLKGVPVDTRFTHTMNLVGNGLPSSDTDYSKNIILSRSLADRLDVKMGDRLQLYFIQGGASVPRVRLVTVAGLYHTGLEDLDQHFALCDIRLLQRINGWSPGQVSVYQIQVDDDSHSDHVAQEIFDRYVKPPETVYTMKELYGNIYDWLQLQDVNSRIILIIMAIVSVINLAVALVILIVEQTKAVALLKAQGMSPSGVRAIFLYHAAIIAFSGIFLGNVLALAICFLQQRTGFLSLNESAYYMKAVPVKIVWWQLFLVDISTLGICVACMCLPALYLRRVRPASALRME